MIKNGPNPSAEVARRVDSWFERNYEDYPQGLEEYQTNEDGFEIKLDHNFQDDLFIRVLDEIDGFDGNRLSDESISVQKVEKVGEGLLHRHSIGVTFGPDNVISLGGYDEPILESGEPTDSVVDDTISLLLLYLESHNR